MNKGKYLITIAISLFWITTAMAQETYIPWENGTTGK